MYTGCRTPDIDVDGDGLEAFCDSNDADDNKTVDVCIDGDGTVIKDEVDGSGVVTKQCTEAVDKNGTTLYRTSVTGFPTREAAKAFCEAISASGKSCFVK